MVRHPEEGCFFQRETDARILQAARKFASKDLGIPILLGNRLEIKITATRLDIKLDNIRVINHLESEDRAQFKQILKSIKRFESHSRERFRVFAE